VPAVDFWYDGKVYSESVEEEGCVWIDFGRETFLSTLKVDDSNLSLTNDDEGTDA